MSNARLVAVFDKPVILGDPREGAETLKVIRFAAERIPLFWWGLFGDSDTSSPITDATNLPCLVSSSKALAVQRLRQFMSGTESIEDLPPQTTRYFEALLNDLEDTPAKSMVTLNFDDRATGDQISVQDWKQLGLSFSAAVRTSTVRSLGDINEQLLQLAPIDRQEMSGGTRTDHLTAPVSSLLSDKDASQFTCVNWRKSLFGSG